MVDAFVRLTCPECGQKWEANPSDLPAPREEFDCDSCAASRSLSEFMRTERDLEIVEEFH